MIWLGFGDKGRKAELIMTKISHIALWCNNLEESRHFYERYFEAVLLSRYRNSGTGFCAYGLGFEEGDTQLALMYRADMAQLESSLRQGHFAISVGSRQTVDSLTLKLKTEGVIIRGMPRITGDGMYESVVIDPAGNIVEITE